MTRAYAFISGAVLVVAAFASIFFIATIRRQCVYVVCGIVAACMVVIGWLLMMGILW
jgi:hypothetical protein